MSLISIIFVSIQVEIIYVIRYCERRYVVLVYTSNYEIASGNYHYGFVVIQ